MPAFLIMEQFCWYCPPFNKFLCIILCVFVYVRNESGFFVTYYYP